jgi:hypothetical protein
MAARGRIAQNRFAAVLPEPTKRARQRATRDDDLRQRRMEGRNKRDSDAGDSDPLRVARELAASDRRHYARYSVRGKWLVHDRARSRAVGIVCDIGLGGLRMRSPDPVPPARRYALSVEVDIDGVDRPRIEVIARCAWHRASPDRQFEAGFEFVEMTPQMRERIANYIDTFGF